MSMQGRIARAWRLIAQPEREWCAIGFERESALHVLVFYLAPLALIAPLAQAAALLMGTDGLWFEAAGSRPDARDALLWGSGVWANQVLGVLTIAAVIWVLAPLYRTARDFGAACRLVAYAGTPVWIAGIVLAVPLQRFPLLIIIVLIALFHAAYLLYLGLHHVAKIRLGDAAECAGIVAFTGLWLSTVVGYLGAATGWFTQG